MPKFNSREEYEQWKKERLQSNLEKARGPVEENLQTPQPPSRESVPQPDGTLRPIGDLFRGSWEIFKARFGTLIALYLFSIVIFILILVIFIGIGYALGVAFPEKQKTWLLLGGLLGSIPGTIALFWGIGAFICGVADESLSMGDALRKGWQRVWSFMWLLSLAGFIITGGFLLFLIPGVIFLVWFTFAQFILAAEDDRGMNALLKSKEYVRGRWFDVFLRLFVIWLVASGLGIIPFIGPFIALLFTPFVMIFINLIYQDLRAERSEGFSFAHSGGEKFKWIGAGALGYVVAPLILIAFMGAALTIPLLMLKGMIASQGQEFRIVPPKDLPFNIPPTRPPSGPSRQQETTRQGSQTETGMMTKPGEKKPDAIGEASIVRNGSRENYTLKTGFFSDTDFKNPQRATVTFQLPSEQHSNARRIVITVNATRPGQYLLDGKAINDVMFDRSHAELVTETTAIFKFIADGGQIFPPKDRCTLIIASPYTGTPESVFAGEINDCVVHSAGINHTISAKFRMLGVPSK